MSNWDIILLIVLICLSVIYCTSVLAAVYKTVNTTQINNNYSYTSMMEEFYNYSLLIISRMVMERLLKSETDANGSKLALTEISDPSQPFYQGIIVSVISSMSDEMRRRFYTFYKEDKENYFLVTTLSSIVETYSIIIVSRIKLFEKIAIKENKNLSKHDERRLIDINTFVNGKIIESILNDIEKLSNNKLSLFGSQDN